MGNKSTKSSKESKPEKREAQEEDFPFFRKDVAIPAEILQLFHKLSNLKEFPAEDYFPPKVEVMFWDYSYAPDAPLVWPSEYPDLQSEDCVKRSSGYSVFMDGKHCEAVEKIVSGMGMRQPVLINDQKMAISYRVPFPGEHYWMGESCPSKSKVEDIYGPPLFVLIGFNVWANVVGADTPSLVLYKDGTLLWGENKISKGITLKDLGIDGLVQHIQDQHFDIGVGTDQRQVKVLYWGEESGSKSVGVYGELEDYMAWAQSKQK